MTLQIVAERSKHVAQNPKDSIVDFADGLD